LCRPSLIAAGLLLLSAVESHADSIAFAGFEGSDTWTGEAISGSAGVVTTDVGSADFPPLQRVLEGTHSFQTNLGTGFADFAPVDISGFDGVQLTLHVSSTSASSGNGSDAADNVQLFVALNGAAFSTTPDITISGNSNARWGFNASLFATTAAGTPFSHAAPQSGTSANNYGTFLVTIPDSAVSIDIRIATFNDNIGEFWNVDSVSLSGTAVPEPSAFAAMAGGLGILVGFRRLRRSPRRPG
jgi:hypothetical protein